LSLRATAPGGSGGQSSAPSPAHASSHRGVQRSISATSNKPRRGSTGAETNACELTGAPAATASEKGQGQG